MDMPYGTLPDPVQAVFGGIALVVIALHKRPASTDGSDPAIGRFRLYTLRRAQPLSMCRHTEAVFPASAPWPLERRVGL